MTLTTEECAAIRNGERVTIVIDGARCLLLREDVYEQSTHSTEPSPRDTYATVLKALDRDDESPEQYLEYLDE